MESGSVTDHRYTHRREAAHNLEHAMKVLTQELEVIQNASWTDSIENTVSHQMAKALEPIQDSVDRMARWLRNGVDENGIYIIRNESEVETVQQMDEQVYLRFPPEVNAFLTGNRGETEEALVPLFRELTVQEEEEFRAHARENYTPGEEIDELFHPIWRDEARKMNEERGIPEPFIPAPVEPSEEVISFLTDL